MTPEQQNIYSTTLSALSGVLIALKDAAGQTHESSTIENDADHEYCLSEALSLVENLKKLMNKERSRLVKNVCTKWQERGIPEPVRTEYLTSTPYITVMPKLPSPTSADTRLAYQEMLKSFGMNFDAVSFDLFRPYWPGFSTYVAELQSQGKPIPPGCKPASFIKFDLKHAKKRKGVTE
jgi:hypothetical protein